MSGPAASVVKWWIADPAVCSDIVHSSVAFGEHECRMLMTTLLSLAAVESPAQKPVIVSRTQQSPLPPLVPPTPEGLAESLRHQLSNPDIVTEGGKTYFPDIEVSDVKCDSPVRRSYTCKYRYRVRRHGQASFGPWFTRNGRFALLEMRWSEIVDRTLCTGGDAKSQPNHCTITPKYRW